MKNFHTFLFALLISVNLFAQDCENKTVRGFTPNYQSQVDVCIEEVCDLGSDFHINQVQLTFPASSNIYETQCFRYTTLPGFSGEDSGIATVCNDDGKCSEVPVSFIVGVSPNCLPDTIEVEVEVSGSVMEVCLEEYCSDLGALNFTLLNPPMWAYDPMGKGQDLCVEHYSLPSSEVYQEIYQTQICNDDSNTYCDTVTFVLNIGNPTSIEGFEAIDFIEVYPNPASDFLHFSLSDFEVVSTDFEALLYNTKGEKISQSSFEGINQSKSYSMNISDLPKGIYFLHLRPSIEKSERVIGVHRVLIK